MKKIALFALAALCVSAAQAVTINWSATGATNFESATMGIVLWNGDTSSAQEFVMAAMPSYSGSVIGDFKSRVASGVSWCDSQSDENPVRAQLGSHGGTTWGGVAASTATSGSVTVFNNTYTDEHKAAWDDIATVIFFDGTSANAHYVELTAAQVQSLIDGTNVDINVGSVPEPTALALLALGVAGLALKRKNA